MGASGEDDLAGLIDRSAFERDGAVHLGRRLADFDIETLRTLADDRIGARPGARLTDESTLSALLTVTGAIGAAAASLTSAKARPVRAVLFDKSPGSNWLVAWHQDRTISVKARMDVEGFGPWSTKDGATHVAPPFAVLSRMVTLRVHLDDVEADNAPLRIAVGSHRLGRIEATEAARTADQFETRTCLANTGDIWAYRTPILHASDRAGNARRRRVLQVDYADFDLPGGLEWRGPC